MGTSSVNSSLASNLATLSSPQSFTGVSKYSSDLQTILSRYNQIAQMPVIALQNDQATLKTQASDLAALQSSVATLASSLTALGKLTTGGALSASSDDTNVGASVSGTGPAAGTYTIGNVTSLASLSTATMTSAVADPNSTAVAPTDTHTLYLVAGGSPVKIQLTSQTNNLYGLRDAINASGAGVTASVLSTSQGFYLTMTANTAGPTGLQLLTDQNDPATGLMTTDHTGALAEFEVNGKQATSTSNQVTGVIPGVTLNLMATMQSGETATVTVAASATPVANALQSFASAYNSLLATLETQFGSNAGSLSGNSAVIGIRSAMQQIAFFRGSGNVQTLADLGLTFDNTGKLSVDTGVVSGMSSGQLADALNFLGSGSSSLSSLAASFNSYSDTASGVLQQQINQDQSSVQRLQNQIDEMTVRIAAAQKAETAKLEAADALLAQLDSQQSMLTASIQSMNYALYGASLNNQSSSSGG